VHALDQGREVFTIPGSIRNPMVAGCHRLIKQGATVVDGIEDILPQMPIRGDGKMSPERTLSTPRLLKADALDSDEQRVFGCLRIRHRGVRRSCGAHWIDDKSGFLHSVGP